MPKLNRTSTLRALTIGAITASSGLLAACIPPPAAMPLVQTARVNIPAIPLAAAPNLAVDNATIDAAAGDACAAGGASASSDVFFGSYLGSWAAKRLATETTTLADQQRLLGTLFTSGYYGGITLKNLFGVNTAIGADSPFASTAALVKSMSTTALSQLAGQMLATANGDPVAVRVSVTAMLPLINQIKNGLQQASGPMAPAGLANLIGAVLDAANATFNAATAGAAGDVAAARRAETAAAGILVWAGGYYMGVMADAGAATPTLTC